MNKEPCREVYKNTHSPFTIFRIVLWRGGTLNFETIVDEKKLKGKNFQRLSEEDKEKVRNLGRTIGFQLEPEYLIKMAREILDFFGRAD